MVRLTPKDSEGELHIGHAGISISSTFAVAVAAGSQAPTGMSDHERSTVAEIKLPIREGIKSRDSSRSLLFLYGTIIILWEEEVIMLFTSFLADGPGLDIDKLRSSQGCSVAWSRTGRTGRTG